MQQGRGGMGMHKHGVSGKPGRSPRYKFMQTLEANRRLSQKPKRSALTARTVAEAIRHSKEFP